MKKYLLISEKPSLMRVVESAYRKSGIVNEISVDFESLHGHCCTLASPEYYKQEWKQWRMESLPIIPDKFKHVPIPTDEVLVNQIKQKLDSGNYDGLINCTDAEREGQNIFYSLYEYLNCKLPVKRFWVNDLTDEKLIEGWNNLRDDLNDPFFVNLTSASMLRANIDWLIGMNFSRVTSITNNKVIPVGRVMTVVLNILAKREIDIKNFKPTESFDVIANYSKGFSGKFIPEEKKTNGAFETAEEATKFIETLGKKAVVNVSNTTYPKENAPLLYSLGDLQNDANRNYGYTLAQSLQVIQGLYEKKILSYPRTDSNYLTTGEAKRISTIVNACKLIPDLSNVNIESDKMAGYSQTRYVDDSKVKAHYAIVFTGTQFSYNNLSIEEQNILTLVSKRILATLMDPAVYEDVKVETSINDNTFKSFESRLIETGWKSIYGYEVDTDITIKDVSVDQILNVEDFTTKVVMTTCPPRYNDESINKAMINIGNTLEDKELSSILKGEGSKDQGGIGTPATRSQILEKLLEPKKSGKDKKEPWVIRKGKSFQVTELGLDIANTLKDYSISSAELTAKWEQKLKRVEDGDLSYEDFEVDMLAYVKDECENLKQAHISNKGNNTSNAVYMNEKCPFCNSKLKKSEKYYYCENYRNETNNCLFIIGKDSNGAKISDQDINSLCVNGITNVKKFKGKDGNTYDAKLKIDKENLKINRVYVPKFMCSCGGGVFERTGQYGKFYACEKCKKIVNQKYFGKNLDSKDVASLMNDKNVDLVGLISKQGKSFNAKVGVVDGKLKIIEFLNNK